MRMLIVLVALCAVVHGQEQTPSAQTNMNRATTGSISGKVVNESGQPVAGASAVVRLINSTHSPVGVLQPTQMETLL